MFDLFPGELVVDNFAGGGGASEGIEQAIGRPVDLAINHDARAIAMHKANHPETKHFCENIWEVDPREACGSRPVGLAWFSPDCTHFSRAKGSTPKKKEIRALADVVIRWAETVQPRIILLENVEEFQTWGPLDDDGQPIKSAAGDDFRAWLGKLAGCGYTIEFRSLVAADYGAPTTRKRLYMIARRDGMQRVWPTASHGPEQWRGASEIIDWSIPCPSIFERKRVHKEATLRRIATGISRYAVNASTPFIVRHGHYSTKTGAGLREGCGAGTFRGQPLSIPLATVCATNDKHLVIPFITKHFTGVVGHEVTRPLGAITARDHHALSVAWLNPGERDHAAEVLEFLRLYAPSYQGSLFGVARKIVDIGTRMLQPHELFAAQGFPDDYVIDLDFGGKPLTQEAQNRLCGNSVSPVVARALVAENALAA
jgi:DNA (cytosine-5)-methyltransferase 1